MNTNPYAKRILCFGDSLTWGHIPGSEHDRYPLNKRWTGILQTFLGNNYEIIEEGLCGRTLDTEDPTPGKEDRCGSKYFIPCIKTHDPIDLVILMLGTNDLKDKFDISSESLRPMLENKYIRTVKSHTSQVTEKPPHLLLISPPYIDTKKDFARSKYANSRTKLKELERIYKELADQYKLPFLRSSEIVTTGKDGVHFDHNNHKILAKKTFDKIQTEFRNL